MCKKCFIVRFLKVDDSMFIYEEFNGNTLREIVINVHYEINKRQTKKSTSVMIGISSEPAKKHPKFQDKTHPVTKEEFIQFLDNTAKILSETNIIKEINLPGVLYRLLTSNSKKKPTIKLLDQKKLKYIITHR